VMNVDARFLYFRVLGCIYLSMLLRDVEKEVFKNFFQIIIIKTRHNFGNGTNRNFNKGAKAQNFFI